MQSKVTCKAAKFSSFDSFLTSDGKVSSLVTVHHVWLWPDFRSQDYLLASWVVICLFRPIHTRRYRHFLLCFCYHSYPLMGHSPSCFTRVPGYCKKLIDLSFVYICPGIDNEFTADPVGYHFVDPLLL